MGGWSEFYLPVGDFYGRGKRERALAQAAVAVVPVFGNKIC